MKDEAKSKAQLIDELDSLRKRFARLETCEPNQPRNDDRFKAIFDNFLDVVIIIDGYSGEILNVNLAAHHILGHTRETLIGKHFSILFPPESKIAALETLRIHGAVLVSQPFLRADGIVCLMDLTATLIPWGQSKAIVATLRDATEREAAEAALRVSEERFRQVISSISDHIYMVEAGKNGKSIIRYLSPNFTKLTGYSRDRFKDDDTFWPSAVVHPGDKDVVAAHSEKLLQGQDSETEYRLVRADDRVIWVRDNARVEIQGASKVIYGIVSNVTEHKYLEDQLRQALKMEAIGRLAGGIAHDFNNLLVVITGYSELLLQRYVNSDDPIYRHIEEIKRAGNRATTLTGQLLAFSRRQVFQPKVLDLNVIVIDMEKMLRRLIGEDIELITMLDPALRVVKTDRGQVEQVIMNLAVNARDAMPQGGKLTIKTNNVLLNKAHTRQQLDIEPGPYVMLTISDTGVGMDEYTKAHIFEPFFTTKAPGHGTGLGLATIHGIVKQSGGHIWVYSELGHGTVFKVYLPQVAEKISVDHEQPRDRSWQGTETILLVEDEATVRTLTYRVLRSYGYTVLEASHGAEALHVFHQHSGTIQLLLTDLIMPGGMNGLQLAEKIVSLSPDIKTLYISGYTDDAIIQQAALDPETTLLQKPFSPEVLARRIREILD